MPNNPLGFNAGQDFQTCQQHFQFTYRFLHPDAEPWDRGLQPTLKGPALAMGTAYHFACETFDLTGSADKGFAALREAWDKEVESCDNLREDEEMNIAKLEKMFTGFLVAFNTEYLEQVASEQAFDLPLDDPRGGSSIMYGGAIDRIVRAYRGIVCVLERKTTGADQGSYFGQYQLHRGLTGYVWAARQLYPEANVQGIILEACGKPRKKPRCVVVPGAEADCLTEPWYRRELYIRTQSQIDVWAAEECAIQRGIARCDSGEEPWIRNTHHCTSWMGFRTIPCDYRAVCTSGGNTDMLVKLNFRPAGREEKPSG